MKFRCGRGDIEDLAFGYMNFISACLNSKKMAIKMKAKKTKTFQLSFFFKKGTMFFRFA